MSGEGQLQDEYVHFRLRDIPLSHPGLEVTMPLISVHGGEPRCVASSFIIGPGLGVTAAHVMYDWMHYQERAEGYLRPDTDTSVSAYQIFKGTMYRWVVKAAYAFERSDIAFLRFFRPTWWGEAPEQVIPPWARLNLNPPQVGDEVRVLGFPGSRIKNGVVQISPTESKGRITEITHNTDIRGRPLSHAHLEGEIAGGMSGGPCFDKYGNVIGVNSKGWDFHDVGPPLSYVALWWQAMGIPIDFFDTGRIPILHLLRQLPTPPLGHRRVLVTSKGELLLGNVDPDSLQALPMQASDEVIDGWLGKADKDMQRALSEIDSWFALGPKDAGYLDAKAIYASLQQFFWALESAALLAIRLAAVRARLEVANYPADWESFVAEWSSRGDSDVSDELASLSFSWYGVELFEVREYANQARNGGLFIESEISPEGGIRAAMLLPCREGGDGVMLPHGLARHGAATIAFGRQLLKLAGEIAVA